MPRLIKSAQAKRLGLPGRTSLEPVSGEIGSRVTCRIAEIPVPKPGDKSRGILHRRASNRDILMAPRIARFGFPTLALLALLAWPAAAEVQTDLWSGQRALDIIVQLLKFTPRSMETVGHQQAIDYIIAELKKTKFSDIKTQRWVEHTAGRTMAMTLATV